MIQDMNVYVKPNEYCQTRLKLLLLLLLTVGVNNVWGQNGTLADNGDGYYYIINTADGGSWYLKPADIEYEEGMPYLTTNKTGQVPGSLWIIKSNGDFHQVIHAEDMKYVTIHNPKEFGTDYGNHRARMHLESIPTPGDNNDFVFVKNGNNYNIKHKTVTSGNNKWWNPANGNSTYDDGGKKKWQYLIGLFDGTTGGSLWTLTFVKKCVTPEISVAESGNVTITSVTPGTTIYYTFSSTEAFPTSNWTVYAPDNLPSLGDHNTIRAIAIKDTFTNSDVAAYRTGKCQTPIIELNKANGLTTITPHADDTGAKIYYTIDGTTPTTSSTEYTGPFTLSVDATAIKAIAAFAADGKDASPVAERTLTKLAPPTFSKSDATVTINKPTKESDGTTDLEGPEAAVYYNLNNNNPTTSSTLYSSAITLPEDFNQTTIKAIAYKSGYIKSDVASQSIEKCATPTIINNGDGTVTLSCAIEGATIRYTISTTETAPDDPTKNSTAVEASGTVTLPAGTKIIKARAFKAGFAQSNVLAYTLPKFPMPKITNNNGTAIITCKSGGTIYYSTSESGPFTQYQNGFSLEGVTIVRAYATCVGYLDSDITSWIPATLISSASQVTDLEGNYIIDGSFSGSIGTAENPFKGTIDGQGKVISGLGAPLVAYADGATIKNVILDNVSISGGTNVGAICNEATGATRIYNCGVLASNSAVTTDDDGYTKITACSSTISGSGYVGGIVGLLDGSSRVINCFSYANITGGSEVGGIVGHNNVATTASNLKTMVMNCMFYGDLTGSTNKAPIYNGQIISNVDATGVSNFNYFSEAATYVVNKDIQTYNCALMAETRYLQRFEFFRHLLNSNRALAAWWATDDADNKDEMMKWVLEPSQIGSKIPYPILKMPYDEENNVIQYPSVVNIDAKSATTGQPRNKGGKLGELSVTIQMGGGGVQFGPPTGAYITQSSLTLNITDKDPDHFNFNYGKVQLPYYNDVGMGNYTGNRVVTGWKITSITGGTTGSFTTGTDATANANGEITVAPYNFADRHCTNKDLYSVSGRIFNQGAYWDVPEGVTAITIQPYWAQAVYCADDHRDVVYNTTMTEKKTNEAVAGGKLFDSGKDQMAFNGSSQTVYNSISSAQGQMTIQGGVYDNAIVLVGNVHSNGLSSEASDRPYTIMSIDLDKDNEPDYSYILRFNDRKRVHPVRVDFLNVIGLGMAQKSTGGQGTYNLGIMQPYGWFEVTNTGLFRVTQFEYDRNPRSSAPMILHGGVIEQWVTVAETSGNVTEANAVDYYHMGSNVWFKEFHIGVHQDRQQIISPHPPISVTGGDFNEFYLTGLYNTPNANYDDNAECYINGGRFGKVGGTGMQGIGHRTNHTNGNIIWQIDNADIDEFYAGGINAAHIAEGNITTVISNSRVDLFCGGPKFGDMNSNKKVVTTATDCTFRAFFGAGYGGNSYNRRYPNNKYNDYNYGWNSWLGTEYTQKYDAKYNGVETRIDYQFIPKSDNTLNVARLFVDYVSFSLATTYDVTSKLTDCTITRGELGRLELFDQCIGNFYGGGSLGKVAGPVKSTLTNCIVEGNVFGAGYSATLPTVKVMQTSFANEPSYDNNLGAYFAPTYPEPITYTWAHREETVNSTARAIDKNNHILYTNLDLSETNLGSVSGAVTLTITTSGENGETIIGTNGVSTTGYVYGGGDASTVNNTTNPTEASTTVTIKGKTTVRGNVFGGGNKGIVSGSTTVNIE